MKVSTQTVVIVSPPTCYKSRKHPIDPTTDQYHGQYISHVSFQHVGHHIWVSHGILRNRSALLGLEIPGFLVIEKVSPSHKSYLWYVLSVFSEQSGPYHNLTVNNLIYNNFIGKKSRSIKQIDKRANQTYLPVLHLM